MSKGPKAPVTATAHQTVDALVERSGRGAVPIRRSFLQGKNDNHKSVPGPMAQFISSNDRFGLLLYLLAITCSSAPPFDVGHHAAVWARALGLRNPTSTTARSRVSKAWGRIEGRGLVNKQRRNRIASITLLNEDASGEPYVRPKSDFMNVKHAFWTGGPAESERWYEILTLPELAVLLIAHHNADQFSLPAERAPDYYGVSADTFQRGARLLAKRNLLIVEPKRVVAPLAPTGSTFENRYTLAPPFGPFGKVSTATGRSR